MLRETLQHCVQTTQTRPCQPEHVHRRLHIDSHPKPIESMPLNSTSHYYNSAEWSIPSPFGWSAFTGGFRSVIIATPEVSTSNDVPGPFSLSMFPVTRWFLKIKYIHEIVMREAEWCCWLVAANVDLYRKRCLQYEFRAVLGFEPLSPYGFYREVECS